MAKRDEAMCYLTYIEGSFSSAEVGVNIEADPDGYWYLAVTSTASNRVRARSRCVLLDQRDPVVLTPIDPIFR